jgi:hypothetical protein
MTVVPKVLTRRRQRGEQMYTNELLEEKYKAQKELSHQAEKADFRLSPCFSYIFF